MNLLNKHIILIGFKHVGKTLIGKHLARELGTGFIDLDGQIELLHEKNSGQKYSCRHIMEKNGEAYFRTLETEALRRIISSPPAVISLGGGTACSETNQKLIKAHTVIHITAPRGIVYERILMGGRPAFFEVNQDMLESFNKLYDEREKIYERIHDISILNNSTVNTAVNSIMERLS